MKSTNNAQTTEAMNEKAIAPTWQSFIVEELSDGAQAAVSGGRGPWKKSGYYYPDGTVDQVFG
jgi:hypothetical protein